MTASVVVVTRDLDITADLVVVELAAREIPVMRFDLADFPESLTQLGYLGNGRSGWTGALRGRHRSVDLDAVRAVWWRKPADFAIHPEMSTTERRWAAAEAGAGLGGLLAALPNVHWVNHPARNAEADFKPRQLSVAASCGLAVPPTLITNDPDHVRDFCRTHREAGVVHKPFRGGPGSESGQPRALWTNVVTADDITDAVRRTSHLFQVRVPCAYSVRLTVVGTRLFAARIDTADDCAAVDWRAVHDRLSYAPTEVPDAVAAGMLGVMQTFGLSYAAADLIVTPDGEWVFHGDLNPNGQWAWIQMHTGLPIAATIADELAGGGR